MTRQKPSEIDLKIAKLYKSIKLTEKEEAEYRAYLNKKPIKEWLRK